MKNVKRKDIKHNVILKSIMRPSACYVLCFTFYLVSLASFARAQESTGGNNSGITVSGQGQVKGKPTLVEISAMVSGEAELTSDAIVKYRDAKKKGVTALENMKIAGLEIESDGFSVNSAVDPNAQMAMQRGMPVQPGKQRVQVSERLRIRIKEADKLEPEAMMDALLKVIDTGRDSGLVIGPPPRTNYNYYEQQQPQSMITFKIPDPAVLREQAYKQAIEDAQKRAQRIADLAGLKLGKITSVNDAAPKGGSQTNVMYYYGGPMPQNDVDELSGSVFGQIPFNVKLMVQFEIQK